MRSFFYLQLQERLEQLPDRQGVPAVRTYDLWNEQVDFIEEEEPFDMPAVFLEFMPYKWTTLSGAVQQAAVTVRLHVVTPWEGSSRKGSRYQQQSMERFSLLEEISACLHDFKGDNGKVSFDMFRRTASDTNHNHAEVVEDVEEYTFRAVEKL